MHPQPFEVRKSLILILLGSSALKITLKVVSRPNGWFRLGEFALKLIKHSSYLLQCIEKGLLLSPYQ